MCCFSMALMKVSIKVKFIVPEFKIGSKTHTFFKTPTLKELLPQLKLEKALFITAIRKFALYLSKLPFLKVKILILSPVK